MDYDNEAREFYFYSVNAGCGIWFVFSPAFHKVLSRFSRGRDFEMHVGLQRVLNSR